MCRLISIIVTLSLFMMSCSREYTRTYKNSYVMLRNKYKVRDRKPKIIIPPKLEPYFCFEYSAELSRLSIDEIANLDSLCDSEKDIIRKSPFHRKKRKYDLYITYSQVVDSAFYARVSNYPMYSALGFFHLYKFKIEKDRLKMTERGKFQGL